jgi:hypothetical protein
LTGLIREILKVTFQGTHTTRTNWVTEDLYRGVSEGGRNGARCVSARLLMLFIEGLMEPLRGWVKDFNPSNLQEAIWRTRDLMGSAAKTKFTPRPPINQGEKDPREMDRGRGRMDEATRRELRRKQLCFTCKEPWEPWDTNAWEKERFTTLR